MGRRSKEIVYPHLNDCKGDVRGVWYVEYSVLNKRTGEKLRPRIYEGFDKFTTCKEKKEYADSIIADLTAKLNSGWRPFENQEVEYEDELSYHNSTTFKGRKTRNKSFIQPLFSEYLQWKKPTISQSSVDDYRSKLRQFSLYLESENLLNKDISYFNNELIVKFLKYLAENLSSPNFTLSTLTIRASRTAAIIAPEFMTDISDAYESAYTIMLNLNKTWIQKQGDFFVESPIILLAAIVWYLKIYQSGKYCTFPHAIEFLNRKYADIFPILTSYPQLENYLSPFMDAWEGGAADQLQGQIASAKIPLSRMISPQLYWVMTGNDFTLDINNPDEPKILCVGNNPDRQNIYSAALGLYNSRIVKLINKKGQLKSSVIIDELPTIYFRGLDNLIATARSNKVAVCLGFQDFSQLKRDYGDKEAAVVMNTVGNIFSGQVVGESAKTLSERFGKVLQKRQSMTINRQDKSTSISTQLDSLIPASKISNLTQGMFVGAVSDNFEERIEQKIFHAEIMVDNAKVAAETKAYQKIPVIADFTDDEGNDVMQQVIDHNYNQIKADVKQIVIDELERIAKDPDLQHLIKKE
jgi:DNA-binding transcriptional regulator YbjK